jgi:DNA-binding MarR family transcriptional regulator
MPARPPHLHRSSMSSIEIGGILRFRGEFMTLPQSLILDERIGLISPVDHWPPESVSMKRLPVTDRPPVKRFLIKGQPTQSVWNCLTSQTIVSKLFLMLRSQVKRFQEAYPLIYLACHRRHVRRDATDRSVTDYQLSILNHLDCARGKTLSTLAEHMGVSLSTMSISVARLVRQGHIAQAQDERDARRVSLTLTSGGAQLREQNSVLDPDLVEAMLRSIPATELEVLLQAFEQFVKHAEVLTRKRKVTQVP